jgi:hypothetical protein
MCPFHAMIRAMKLQHSLRGLPLLLLLLTATGCGSPDTCASDCRAYGNLVDACLEEWETEYRIQPVCIDEYAPDWYDNEGNLKSDDPSTMEAYESSHRSCESGDDAYDSCINGSAARASVAEAAGNAKARQDECKEDNLEDQDSPRVQAMHDLNCLGFLQAIGILDQEE